MSSPSSAERTQDRGLVDRVATDLFIGGRWVPATGGGRIDVVDPSTARGPIRIRRR